MSIRVEISPNEIARLRAAFDGSAAKFRDGIRTAVSRTVEGVYEDARSLVPVRTGALRRSIEREIDSDLEGHVEAGGKDVTYHQYVEFGTSRMGAQPYMTPAAEGQRNQFVKRVQEALR